MPDNKEVENVVTLKEFKKQRRLKQKEKRKLRKLEQSKLSNASKASGERKQQVTSSPKLNIGLTLSRCLVMVGAILPAISEAGIQLLDGYMQGNEDIPSYIATANKWLPIVRNLGGFVAMLGLPTLGGKAWLVYVFLFGWSINNNLHWTHTTSTNATRLKETQLEKELLQRPDIALKKESYETSFSDKRRKEKDEKSLCDQNDGTKCIRAKKDTSDAARRYEASKASYDGAMAEAKAKATQETTPIAANPSLWINTILPLIGGILIRLVSRR